MKKYYICIDLKSFYASVECVERNLDPLNTNLVVADSSRTEKTICLAVSPSLKKYGISGRARLYEVVQRVKEVNRERKKICPSKRRRKSYVGSMLDEDLSLDVDYIVALPRMRKYMKYSSWIYQIYLRFVAPEDIFAYSIDEMFCDITHYLKLYKMTPKELITKMIQTVYEETGITATGGIGTNMYLAKIAMDIVAKHMEPNAWGVRIAELDEVTYREMLWNHKPLTDFWRIGKGISKRLEKYHIFTMGELARKSLENPNLFYKEFGVNAELLIDHAWGWEPCEMKDVKSYHPRMRSVSTGQVLPRPYPYEQAKLIVKEMADNLSLDLTARGGVCDLLVLEIGYDIENMKFYSGETMRDFYGRVIPKHAHGTIRLSSLTNLAGAILSYALLLFDSIVDKDLLVRRITITAGNVEFAHQKKSPRYEQLNLFVDSSKEEKQEESHLQEVLLQIKSKYGKNAILKGMNLEEGGTAIERGNQVGGHRG